MGKFCKLYLDPLGVMAEEATWMHIEMFQPNQKSPAAITQLPDNFTSMDVNLHRYD